MKINKLIVKLEDLKEKLELVGLRDVIVTQVDFPEIYEEIFEEIYVSSAVKDKEGKIYIKIDGHEKNVPQELNRINLLKEVPIGTCGHISFYGLEGNKALSLGAVYHIKIGDLELFGKEAEEFAKRNETNTVNLCPDCKVYCEKRFIDGQCK